MNDSVPFKTRKKRPRPENSSDEDKPLVSVAGYKIISGSIH